MAQSGNESQSKNWEAVSDRRSMARGSQGSRCEVLAGVRCENPVPHTWHLKPRTAPSRRAERASHILNSIV
jgi:hypothetical protein